MLAIVAAAPTPTPATSQQNNKSKKPNKAKKPGHSGRSSSRSVVGKVLAIVLLMALAAGGAFAYQRLRPSGPPHPSAWDPQVLPLARFVERERGLTFAHPVFVDLLTEREYARRLTPDAAPDGTGAPDAHALDERDLANAFGLATTFDATAAAPVLAAEPGGGAYLTSSDRILLRGTEWNAGLRVALVHQLMHVLDGQHFGLHDSAIPDLASRGVVEADAARVTAAYMTSLTPDEQAVALAAGAPTPTELAAMAKVPAPMLELHAATTALGPTLVNAAAASGGNAAVDELLRHLPSDVQILSPWRRSTSADTARPRVQAPKGSTLVRAPQDLSVLQVLVMLDAWLPWRVARGAVDHWVAGTYVVYRTEADARLCVDATATFDSAPTEFNDAIALWATLSGSSGTPFAEGRSVSFTACDRGPAAAAPPAALLTTGTELQIEQAATASLTGAVDPAAVTSTLCVERTLIDNTIAAPFLALPAPTPDQKTVVELGRAAARQTCGA
jgi:hypothetical protein